jgi:superfamily II DNA or RNA helicase
MEQPLKFVDWRTLLGAIARALPGESPDEGARIGDVRLMTHQIQAVQRLEIAIQRYGGALLADDVGLGKTYAAIALAARIAQRPLVAAPAALTDMWRMALGRAAVAARVVSIEALGRTREQSGAHDLIVVDEAHHLRNPNTQRYRALALLSRGSRMLLLSATPVHNSERELQSLLALFLGARASRLEPEELACLIVRREKTDLTAEALVPRVVHRPVPRADVQDSLLDDILALPPPVPPADGGEGGALVLFTLVRQWASSHAALAQALRRRLVHGCAMLSALENGVFPSVAQLRAWCASDEAVQLPLFGLLIPSAEQSGGPDTQQRRALHAAMSEHIEAVRDLLKRASVTGPKSDELRWSAIRSVVEQHPGEKCLVFSQFAATARQMFRLSQSRGRSALLTSSAAIIASGKVGRAEVLRMFAPRAAGATTSGSAAARVDLLFSTDVLSEGANLQDASVLIHMDLPWTPARLAQRVGRLARTGSNNDAVTVYTFAPPASAEALLRMERRLAAKLSVAARAVGVAGSVLPMLHVSPQPGTAAPRGEEQVRAALRRFRAFAPSEENSDVVLVASAPCSGQPRIVGRDGTAFLALVRQGGVSRLVGGTTDGANAGSAAVFSLLQSLEKPGGEGCSPAPPQPDDVEQALRAWRRWLSREDARRAIDISAAVGARARRKLLRRIDAIALAAPPHAKPRIHDAVALARRVATGQLGAGAEAVLSELAEAQMPDDSWLHALACFGRLHGCAASDALSSGRERITLRALLIPAGTPVFL